MATNPILAMLGATPEEEAALRKIDMLRRQFPGLPDDQVFQLASAGTTQIGGGAGFLPYVTDLAGIQSNYNLGRGGLASDLLRLQYEQANNPYNVVGAQMQAGDLNNPYGGDGTIPQLEAQPESPYARWVRENLFGGLPAAGQAPAPVTPALDDATRRTIEDAYRRDAVGADDFFRRASPPAAAPVTQAAPASVGDPAGVAGRNASRLLASTLQPGTPRQFVDPLARGEVPGFGTVNDEEFGRLTLDQQRNYIGRAQATGRYSNAGEAFADYQRRYSHGGAGFGGTYR